MPAGRRDPITQSSQLAGHAYAGAGKSGRILVVEDEAALQRLISRSLARRGHDVDVVATVPEALNKIAVHEYDLVLTDLRLPGPSGLDLLLEVRACSPESRLILMSGHADVPAAASAIDRGVDSLLTKPFDLEELVSRVDESLERRRSERTAAHERMIMEARLRQRDMESRVLVLRAAHSLAAAVEAKDAYTAGHAVRVTAYAMTLAEEVGNIDLLRFRLAGDLHDIGKIGVPDHILNKPGRLTDEEMDRVREHPAAGAKILDPLIDDPMVIGVVRWHHERWDGRGYPDQLKGDRIPLPARVLAIADTLDAMTSDRAYRPGLPWEVAAEEIYAHAGEQFDPGVVDAFDRVAGRVKGQYEAFRRMGAAHVGQDALRAGVPRM